MTDLSSFNVTGTNNDSKQVSVTVWNEFLRALETAIDAGGGAAWGAITGTLASQTDLQTALDAKAALASPALTGTPTAPTAAAATNTTQIATTAFVQAAVTALINAAPGALDTLDELAAALGDDANFATTVTNALAGKLAIANNLSDLANAATARTNLGINSTNIKLPEPFIVAVSDETTALTTGTAKITFRMPYAFTLTAVRASVTTAPTGAALQVDINEGGVSILSTKLTIDATEKTSTTAATPAVISDSSLADDAEITIDVDQIGSTIAGAGLKVMLIGTRT